MSKFIRIGGALLGLACLLSAPLQALGQDYPSRPVKIVVASVPGSAPDVLARLLAERLTPNIKQQVLVENRPGAGGVIGVDAVAKAPADGYTLVIGHDGTMALSTIIHKALPYDPLRDFAPISMLGINEFVLVAATKVGVRTFAEFLAHAKSRQGRATYGSAGVGTPNQLFMEQLAAEAGFAMIHVPYKGGAAAVSDLVGGQIDFMMAGLAPALPHIRSGALVAIAVPQASRSGALPNVPPISDTVAGFTPRTWFALFAPAAVPAATIARLNREVRATLAEPELQTKLAQQGLVTETSNPAAVSAQIRADIQRYRGLATRIKLEAN